MHRNFAQYRWPTLLTALCAAALPVASLAGTTVRMQTALGVLDIRLLDEEAPATVANFLAYQRTGAYDMGLLHRSVPGFVVQGGGYRWTSAGATRVTASPPVANEFSSARSNVCATVAMAKVAGNPNSATSEWFVNMANNAANLDGQNGGFTVFGRVTGPGMATMTRIADLPILACSSPFNSLPVRTRPPSCSAADASHLVLIERTRVLPEPQSDSDRVMNYLEAAYTQFLGAEPTTTGEIGGYAYRYYAGTNAYIATKDGQLFYLGPAAGPSVAPLGALTDWAAIAAAQGYGPQAAAVGCGR